jgi:ribosomal protein S18 acetylase RimI-like enzyme
MAVVVREVRPEEYAAAGLVTLEAYRADAFNVEGEYDDSLRDVARRATESDILVAVDEDGAIQGTVMFVRHGSPWTDLATAEEAEFRMLGVSPSARGRGVGEALVRACIERTRRAGLRRLVLATQPRMRPAQRLYERLGFVRAPDRDFSPLPGLDLMAYTLEISEIGTTPAPEARP